MRETFIAGNWKMNKDSAQALQFAETFKKICGPTGRRVVIAAPYTQLSTLKEAFRGTEIQLAAQNMHYAEDGAFTGEISASMLNEIGVDFVILGHSERRQFFGESDEYVALKVLKAFEAGIRPIVCIGEDLAQRDGGLYIQKIRIQMEAMMANLTAEQLSRLVVAYEPLWAIGTGRTATVDQVEEIALCIRQTAARKFGPQAADSMLVLYGGSVKPSNADDFMKKKNVDGVLVGGASLDPHSFLKIVYSDYQEEE